MARERAPPKVGQRIDASKPFDKPVQSGGGVRPNIGRGPFGGNDPNFPLFHPAFSLRADRQIPASGPVIIRPRSLVVVSDTTQFRIAANRSIRADAQLFPRRRGGALNPQPKPDPLTVVKAPTEVRIGEDSRRHADVMLIRPRRGGAPNAQPKPKPILVIRGPSEVRIAEDRRRHGSALLARSRRGGAPNAQGKPRPLVISKGPTEIRVAENQSRRAKAQLFRPTRVPQTVIPPRPRGFLTFKSAPEIRTAQNPRRRATATILRRFGYPTTPPPIRPPITVRRITEFRIAIQPRLRCHLSTLGRPKLSFGTKNVVTRRVSGYDEQYVMRLRREDEEILTMLSKYLEDDSP
jgi:hypothetical protein